MNLILLVMRIFLGAVFIYSGWGKLIAPIENFIAAIEGYHFLKQPFVSIVAFLLPWLELIFGTFLVLGYLTRASAAFLGAFLAVFIFLLSRGLMLHLPISECGCFGSGIVLGPWQAILLDSGLLAVSLVMMCSPPRLLSLDKKLHQ